MEKNKEFEVTGKTLQEIYEEIREIYFSNNYPWIIGYSGGKDSTTTLQLVWEALESLPRLKLNKPVYVLSSDTLVEIPKVVNYVDKTLDLINKAAKERGLPFEAVKVIPDITDTFWVNLIGRGYAAPTKDFRWCTDKLKIKPANKFVIEAVSVYGEVIVVLGVRKAESINREKTINKHKIENSRLFLSASIIIRKSLYIITIEDWIVDEVWFHSIIHSSWGGNNENYSNV